mgnify:CR=1 FL=1
MDKKYGVFSSSVDPNKLSLTIRGLLKSGAAVAVALAPFFSISSEDVTHVFDSLDAFMAGLDTLIASGLIVWGLGETVVGAVRKIVVRLKLRS